MHDTGLPPDFDHTWAKIAAASGVQGRTQQVPDDIDLTWLKIHCGRLERVLRNQYKEDPSDPKSPRTLPPEWDAALRVLPPTNTGLALQRYALLKHYYMVRNEGLVRRGKPGVAVDDQAMLAAYQLLTREPIDVDIGTRVVQVTDRPLAALVMIARHEARMNKLMMDLEAVRETKVRYAQKIIDAESRAERNRIRKRVEWLFELEETILYETFLHRQALYAHVFTPDGMPANVLDDAPEWWEEVDRAGDFLILQAVNQAGSGRVAELGEEPEPPKDPDSKGSWETQENFGWLTVTSRWGIRIPIRPAPYIHKPLGQLTAFFRLARDPVYVKD